jgi:hypothetical protein
MAPGWLFPSGWLIWPPDTFALTSTILRQTGCYRHVVTSDRGHADGWQDHVESCAKTWLRRLNAVLADPAEAAHDAPNRASLTQVPGVRSRIKELRQLAPTVPIEDLCTLESDTARRLAEILLEIHAIADTACAGFGLPSSPQENVALVHCLANLLLTARGSLSRVAKHYGVVLPKLRTPQSGLTLRSLAHHVTLHTSEVEVMWRAVPWPNVEENTINILIVPWPLSLNEASFCAKPETFESVRYFAYTPAQEHESACIERTCELVKRLHEQVGRVHMVAFPELAFSEDGYIELLQRLQHARDPQGPDSLHQVPMILTGISNGHQVTADGTTAPSQNEVRLATYFAGRWYECAQQKHHRWKMDRNQVRQYQLEGRLSTARDWVERIDIAQRRLTFLAPTGWLALTPLICEDLAQLEPVSDLIRGVGPTLLIALLLDGPQLKERWSARYAGVFADDPGTAVLTVTALGMAERSRKNVTDGGRGNRTAALWKDQLTGWQTFDIPSDAGALLVTISASWREEFTADGRSDYKSASVFSFEGVRFQPFSTEDHSDASSGTTGRPIRSLDPDQRQRLLASWADIRELTAATFALDALIELRQRHRNRIRAWLLGRPQPQWEASAPEPIREIVRLLRTAQVDPARAGVKARQDAWPTPALETGAEYIAHLFDAIGNRKLPEPSHQYWRVLFDITLQALEKQRQEGDDRGVDDHTEWERRRAIRAVLVMTLVALHSRVDAIRRRPSATHALPERSGSMDQFLTRDIARLLRDLEREIEKYAY